MSCSLVAFLPVRFRFQGPPCVDFFRDRSVGFGLCLQPSDPRSDFVSATIGIVDTGPLNWEGLGGCCGFLWSIWASHFTSLLHRRSSNLCVVSCCAYILSRCLLGLRTRLLSSFSSLERAGRSLEGGLPVDPLKKRNVAFAPALPQSNLFSPVTLAHRVPFNYTGPANTKSRRPLKSLSQRTAKLRVLTALHLMSCNGNVLFARGPS